MAAAQPTNVAFIGLGTMGAPMAARLVAAGFDVTVHNRTRERERLVSGARRAPTPRAAAEGQDVVITMVSDTADVEAVVLGPEGALHGMRSGAVLIDMSTISPTRTREVAQALQARGVAMLDAPVSGGSEGAERGTLTIMVGGDAAVLARVRHVLAQLGRTVTHVGPSGSGQLAKAINQVIIAGTYAAVAEGMALGLAAGLEMDGVVAALAEGAAGSWVLQNRSTNMLKGSYPLGFRTRLHRKDLGIALAEARALGVPLPVAAFVEQLETGLIARGYGDEDVSNLARTVREAAGLD
ncbi:NAD(P)-dependent oxidoreductase [Truepera radiovictrix]|nr:NAD(P)-dependent oxidoreductase [Truepera radiovictrix]WMT58359.1 NAD(P)-dependent oxidoreductase [Truepera radiovictrix]